VKVLIVVDIQNDFLPGGALAVPAGEEVIAVANRVQQDFDLVVATQDWHPRHHGSFAPEHPGKKPGDVVDLHGLTQILWPPHCIQRTHGAEFPVELDTSRFARVFQKGTDANVDSYSGFYDNGQRRSTGMADYLREMRVEETYVLGLATEYCVKFTAVDSVCEGFETHLVLAGCRGVEMHPGDCARAIEEMENAGVWILQRA
jgi:nicotinamidase/pyrazinamidase